VLSIQAGRVMPSMLLRKLGTYSRKSLLYRAFRESWLALVAAFDPGPVSYLALRARCVR